MQFPVDHILPPLSPNDIILIEDVKSMILKDNGILRERLLYDWLVAMENGLYFAAAWVFYVFLEKYVREIFIFNEYHKEKSKFSEIEFLEKIDEIEKEIEEAKNETDKAKYGFCSISNVLRKQNIFTNKQHKELTELYRNCRNPIQHGIYQRLTNKHTWNTATPGTLIKMDLQNLHTKEDFENIFTSVVNQEPNLLIRNDGIFLRSLELPNIMKEECMVILKIIYKLLQQFQPIMKL